MPPLATPALSTLNAPLLLGAVLLFQCALLQASGLCALHGGMHQPRRVLIVAATLGTSTAACMVLIALMQHLLHPAGLDYLDVFAAVIAAALSAQLALASLQRRFSGEDFPRIDAALLLAFGATATAAVVGRGARPLGQIAGDAVLTGLAFALIYVLFAALRERLALSDVPAPFRGVAIQLIGAGLAALALMGFAGLL